MSRLSAAARAALPRSEYVFPDRAPAHGSYPIPDRKHAVAALLLSRGKPEEGAVRVAVRRKFGIG